MVNPLVSVVVPVYNAEMFLAECIESILKQTYKNIQLVLVDDCSTDNSKKICEEYASENTYIKYVSLKHTMGVSRARNCGIDIAEGKYVCFVDADDFVEDIYIEKYLQLMDEYNLPVIYGQLTYYQDGKYLKRPQRLREGIHKREDVEQFLIDDGTVTGILFGSACGAIYELQYIKKYKIIFDEKLKRNEDGVFNLDLLTVIDEFYVSSYAGYYYRQWKDSQTYPCFVPDYELDIATEVIRKRYSDLKDFALQMQRRNISVIFWNAIRIGKCQGMLLDNCCRLEKYIDGTDLDIDYIQIKKDVISIYKRILLILLQKRKIVCFCLLMKYVYPVMKRFR